jgi:predicted anti-sigma-YlaC factor YlaD
MTPLVTLVSLLLVPACSVRRFAVNQVADVLAGTSSAYASDDDPELIEAALPFSLKLVESVLVEAPDHRELLATACSAFTQYCYGFLRQRADELRDDHLAESRALRERIKKLYLRARGYGLRSLEVDYPGFEQELRQDAPAAVARVSSAADVSGLYWTAAAWGLWIGESKDSPSAVADQPLVEAMIDRALELDPDYEQGAIQTFLIAYEMIRRTGSGEPASRAEQRYWQALRLSGGRLATVHLALAEEVAQPKQDRKRFVELCERALAIDVEALPARRLQNILAQRRARWLLGRLDDLFDE